MNNTIFRVGDRVEITYGHNNGKTGKITKKYGSQFYTDVDGHVYDHDELKLINCKIKNDADLYRARLGGLKTRKSYWHKNEYVHLVNGTIRDEENIDLDKGLDYEVYHPTTKTESLKKEMQELKETIDKAQKRCDEINESINE